MSETTIPTAAIQLLLNGHGPMPVFERVSAQLCGTWPLLAETDYYNVLEGTAERARRPFTFSYEEPFALDLAGALPGALTFTMTRVGLDLGESWLKRLFGEARLDECRLMTAAAKVQPPAGFRREPEAGHLLDERDLEGVMHRHFDEWAAGGDTPEPCPTPQ